MNDREEWTPWVAHDGKGCPCVGMWTQAKTRTGKVIEGQPDGRAVNHALSRWVWASLCDECGQVVEYRTRRPRALQQLREMIETLPTPEREDA